MDRKHNQGQFTDMVTADSEVPREDVERVLRSVFDVIGRTVAAGDSITVTNFGTWRSVESAGRIRRNPRTGETFEVAPYRRPVFLYSPAIREAVRTGDVPDTFKKSGNGSAGGHRSEG